MTNLFTSLLDQLTFGSIGSGGGGVKIKSVQRGVVYWGSSDTMKTVDIAPVDLTKSVIIAPVIVPGGVDNDSLLLSHFVSESQIRFRKQSQAYSFQQPWQVVEFEGDVTVQTIYAVPTGTTSATFTISAVDMEKTFLLHSAQKTTITSPVEAGRASPWVYLSNPTTVSLAIYSAATSVDKLAVCIFIVEVK